MPNTESLLEVHGLTKRFPGVVALDSVDFAVRTNEVHVLLGENGAGKSTLVKILSGIYQADEGTMSFAGEAFLPATPKDAIRLGIRHIHQEFHLLSYLTVAENLSFDALPNRFGVLNQARLRARAEVLLGNVGLEISPSTRVENLSIAQMQMVEIAKALSTDSKLLIMDEPTATLTDKEITRLFEIVHQLKKRGVSIIYISHRLQEIFEIGDRYTVLRNGKVVATEPLAGAKIQNIVRMMVGRELGSTSAPAEVAGKHETALEVANLRPRGARGGVSFSVGAGEIVGVAGLVGAGRSEILRGIFGADVIESGTLRLRGQEVKIRSPRDAVLHGISLVTENRKEEGLVLGMSVAANITLANLAAISSSGLLRFVDEKRAAMELIDDLNIRTPNPETDVAALSGGNQQKIVLAKWLFRDAQVLMVDEPTRGIDVGARFEIYRLLESLAERGKAILVVSSDLPELIGLCDRILVLSNGTITGNIPREEFDQERILALAYQEHITPSRAAA